MSGAEIALVQAKVDIDTVLGTTMNHQEFYNYLILRDPELAAMLHDRSTCIMVAQVTKHVVRDPSLRIPSEIWKYKNTKVMGNSDDQVDAYSYVMNFGTPVKQNPAIVIDPKV